MSKIVPGFDAVALQHEGGRRIFEATKDMTEEQELAYWKERSEALLERQRELRRQAAEHTQQAAELVEESQ